MHDVLIDVNELKRDAQHQILAERKVQDRVLRILMQHLGDFRDAAVEERLILVLFSQHHMDTVPSATEHCFMNAFLKFVFEALAEIGRAEKPDLFLSSAVEHTLP